jgi:hypothetical protein
LLYTKHKKENIMLEIIRKDAIKPDSEDWSSHSIDKISKWGSRKDNRQSRFLRATNLVTIDAAGKHQLDTPINRDPAQDPDFFDRSSIAKPTQDVVNGETVSHIPDSAPPEAA